MKTALITHTDCLQHETPAGHPEQVARLEYVLRALEDLELSRISAPLAAEDDILRVHPADYLAQLRRISPNTGRAQIDGDTWMSPGTLTAAFRAAGAMTCAIDMVMAGKVQNAFCAIRPPGHHAETDTAMGFCFFGNAALGAKYALDHHGLERVAVVDFDVHHGNGSQEILWSEPRALLVTSQQMPLWPGSGRRDETGAFNNVVNIPLSPNSDSAVMRNAFTETAFAKLREFQPELIIVSAGFDAHRADPLAELDWDTEDFAWITQQICEIASDCCGGRVVSTLEGGYDLTALSESTRAHVEELMKATA